MDSTDLHACTGGHTAWHWPWLLDHARAAEANSHMLQAAFASQQAVMLSLQPMPSHAHHTLHTLDTTCTVGPQGGEEEAEPLA